MRGHGHRSTKLLEIAICLFFAPAIHTGHGAETARSAPLSFSPAASFDGKRLLSVPDYGKVPVLWDIETGKELRRFEGHTEPVLAVAFSPDGRQILTGSGRGGDLSPYSTDNSARLWDADTGRELQRFNGHTGYVHTVQFNPEGTRILTVGADSTARVWDLKSGQQLFLLSGTASLPPPTGVLFSPDGKQIAGILQGGSRVKVWGAREGKELCAIERDTGFFDSVEFSPDGKQILTASSSGTARTWETATGQAIRAFSGHTSYVRQASFTAGGKEILTASADGFICLWNTDTGKELKRLPQPGPVDQFVISHDGKRLIAKWKMERRGAINRGASLWNLESSRELKRLTEDVASIVGFSPLDERFLTTQLGKPSALWDGATGDMIRQWER